MKYHWVEWDTWDGRTRKFAILEKKIVFEQNKKNNTVLISQALTSTLEFLQKDIDRWNQTNGVYAQDELWKPEVKIFDEVTTRSKVVDLVGRDGNLISFGHTLFEIVFSVKLPKSCSEPKT